MGHSLVLLVALLFATVSATCRFGYEDECEKKDRSVRVGPCKGDPGTFFRNYDYGMIEKYRQFSPWCGTFNKKMIGTSPSWMRVSDDASYVEAKNLLLQVGERQKDYHMPCVVANSRSKYHIGSGFSWSHELWDIKPCRSLSADNSSCLPREGTAEVIHLDKAVLVGRDFPGNIFHVLADVVLAYVALHVKGWQDDEDVQLLMVDGYRGGYVLPITSLWTNLIPWSNATFLTTINPDAAIHIKQAVFSVPNRKGFHYGRRALPTCEGSGLVLDFVERMMKHAGTLEIAKEMQSSREQGTRKVVNVLMISRGPGGGAWGTRQTRNEPQTLEWLREIELPNGYEVNVTSVRLENMPLNEQMAHAARADVLVGMHGAGLTHCLFLPRGAALVEMFNMYDDDEEYLKLASLSGHVRFTWTGEDPAKHHVRKDLVHDGQEINHRLADEEIDERIADVVSDAIASIFKLERNQITRKQAAPVEKKCQVVVDENGEEMCEVSKSASREDL